MKIEIDLNTFVPSENDTEETAHDYGYQSRWAESNEDRREVENPYKNSKLREAFDFGRYDAANDE